MILVLSLIHISTKIAHEIDSNNMVGCMLAGVEYYAYSCHPADVWASINKNRENIMFIDVQARGYYPNYALKMFEREGINLSLIHILLMTILLNIKALLFVMLERVVGRLQLVLL